MVSLPQHLIDLLLRAGECLERLPEVSVYEISEQLVVHPNYPGEQFTGEHVQIDRFIFEQNLGEHPRGDVFVRSCVQYADIVSPNDQLVNLLEAEMPAARAVIVTPVLILSDFQGPSFVAVIFRHGCAASQGRRDADGLD